MLLETLRFTVLQARFILNLLELIVLSAIDNGLSTERIFQLVAQC